MEKFYCNCEFCGAYGHRQRESRNRDRYMHGVRNGEKGNYKGSEKGYYGKSGEKSKG